jgi:integrase
VNPKTGKPILTVGYASRTIAHNLSVVHAFYAFHLHFGQGPVVNPVPESKARRAPLAHRSPLEPAREHRRARLRPKIPARQPRAIPDAQWDELFAQMRCSRDRALLASYVSSGARASELLGVRLGDLD